MEGFRTANVVPYVTNEGTIEKGRKIAGIVEEINHLVDHLVGKLLHIRADTGLCGGSVLSRCDWGQDQGYLPSVRVENENGVTAGKKAGRESMFYKFPAPFLVTMPTAYGAWYPENAPYILIILKGYVVATQASTARFLENNSDLTSPIR